jgi:cytochrome c oxidase cbb3-type subunit 2
VALDFLYDYPVMPGSQRIGPDLANVGACWPDSTWHLRHLYAPRMEIKGSLMPSYRFLFEKRRIEHAVSPDALVLPAGLAAEPGYEIVPKPEAKALAAYLVSLRANEPLFETPLTVASAPPAPATNAAPASAGGTNAMPVAAGATNSTPALAPGPTNSAPTNPPAK